MALRVPLPPVALVDRRFSEDWEERNLDEYMRREQGRSGAHDSSLR